MLFRSIRHRLWSKLASIIGFVMPPAALAMTIYLTKLASPELNIILSLRPYFFNEFIQTTTLVNFIAGWTINDNAGVDNLFLMIASGVGFIGCLAITLYIAFRTFKIREELLPIMITLMAISIFESFLLRPEIPISVLFICLLFSNHVQKVKPTRF